MAIFGYSFKRCFLIMGKSHVTVVPRTPRDMLSRKIQVRFSVVYGSHDLSLNRFWGLK